MKFMKKLLSAVTAAAIGVSMTTALSAGVSVATAADMTAIELVEDMGMGWNLGNSLDCTNTWTNPLTPTAIETAWGNPVTTESMIKEIKKAGFKTVRIPVTWYQMMDSSGTISSEYLARVKEVVDYCVNNDMYAIINIHHDGTSGNWLSAGVSAKDKYVSTWEQIADYFKSYDNHLVFEGLNEVDISNADTMTLNQTFVDTVRASGGNNASRLLLVPAANNNTSKSLSSDFSAPTDSANMVAVSVHYYEPTTFCVAPADSTWGYDADWGTSSDYTILENDFNKLETKFIDSGIPVIIGEYGVLTESKNGKDTESIHKFLEAVASTAYEKTGMCSVLWDTSRGGDMQFFDRETLSWFDGDVQAIYANIASGGEVDTGKEKTDRVTATAADLDDGEGSLVFDLKPYKELGLQVSSVVVDYKMTSAKNSAECSGDINMSFNVLDASGEDVWAYLDNPIGPNETTTTFEMPAGEHEFVLETDDDGNIVNSVTGTLDMDYLKFENWWTWSAATGDTVTVDINSVTVIFDSFFYVDDAGSTGSTTQGATTTSAESTTAATTTTTTNIDVEPYGWVWPAGQAGTYAFWEKDADGVIPVAITGNGSYTASYILPEGDGTGSIECLILDSDINVYQFLPEDYDGSDRVADCGVVLTVDKITLDGEEIAYTGPTDGSLTYGNDGVSLRRNILNTWTSPSVKDIDGSEVSLTKIIEIQFTVSGLPSDNETTTTEEATTTTTTETTTETTTTTSATETTAETTTTTGTTVSADPNAFYGDVNLDSRVDITDAVLLNKIAAGQVKPNDQQRLNADVNASGDLDSSDAIILLKFLVHLVNSLPTAD
ncbi:MAG: cellulase family glycosylhydrolase [Ruminococcus sp.]